ncbi:hypothetical protein CJF32_00003157 [Rutstroemia sp. NJR-2017a WRK4]|nr:hypothetical protein CJF32_00003157 [Rutstroemia sp. NJR-2017a WRK4]
MGWFFSSGSSAEKPAPQTSNPPAAESSKPTTTIPQSKPPPSREELADKELQKFLQELEADTHASSTKYNHVPQNPPSEPSHSSSEAPSIPETNEPLSSQLLPTTMSCRDAFDSAFYCNSIGGQFMNLYRYGEARKCSDKWADFWFCMKTRGYPDHEKAKMIKSRYAEKERQKYGGGEIGKSSEDVWRGREKRLEWGEAFCQDVEEWKGEDDEWRKMERTRRETRRNGPVD